MMPFSHTVAIAVITGLAVFSAMRAGNIMRRIIKVYRKTPQNRVFSSRARELITPRNCEPFNSVGLVTGVSLGILKQLA